MTTTANTQVREPGVVGRIALMALVAGLLLLALAGPARAAFGVANFDGQIVDAGGGTFTQAGGHPAAVSTEVNFNTHTKTIQPFGFDVLWPDEPTKDIDVTVPPGFVGNPTAVTTCRMDQLQLDSRVGNGPQCPATSQIGLATVTTDGLGTLTEDTSGVPVYNIVPPPGVAARFGFNIDNVIVVLDAKLRNDAGSTLSIEATDLSQGLSVIGSKITLWGVPSDPSHDAERSCPGHLAPAQGGPSAADPACPQQVLGASLPQKAFLRMPTSCPSDPSTTGLPWSVQMDSWVSPGVFKTASFATHVAPGLPDDPTFPGMLPAGWGHPQGTTNCGDVPFDPTFSAQPATPASPGASGYVFDLNLPQTDDPALIGESDLRDAQVTLPQGVRVSPSAAGGLAGCSPAQIALDSDAQPTCPDASKVGTVKITTPLLADPLEGSVYLATPHDNPSGSLLETYIVAEGPGLVVKVAGSVTLDAATGQLTATFTDLPQLPFSNLHLEFFGGDRAPLTNPPTCDTYTTHATMQSWSGKTASWDSSFTTSHDGHGAPCPAPQFSPSLNAGTVNPVAGAFTPFTLQLQRTDDDQEFQSVRSLSLPPGLLADVGSVPVRCTEVQARAAACPAGSHVGTVLAGAGAGPDPFYVPGDVYLMGGFSSGPFKGDPFGLAVVVHAVAGPFDLGYVVVEAGIQIHDDGSISAQSEPFPTILQGIPLQLKDIRLNLDRPNFILNPTNCSQLAVAGSVSSTQGLTAGVSNRFQVAGCGELEFRPRFSVSTPGKTSKSGGAGLRVHLATNEGPGGGGGEANIARVDVQLPVVLPARLPTLQKACTAAQFAADPAGCPEGSFVGSAVARTPILASPLSGPAILVSHGGQAFPDLVLVLQGEGVRVDLTGHTQIKNGITYSHFETVPDAPVSSFDLSLPQGPHGVLTTDKPGVRDLCATTRTVRVRRRVTRRVNGHNRRVMVKARRAVAAALLMPTTITAQNGAVLKQTTKIAVTGCQTTKKAKKARRARRAATHGGHPVH
jgi:hypothetical protein